MDISFGTTDGVDKGRAHHQYVETLKEELQQAYKLASENSLKTQRRNKRMYDKKVKHQILKAGDTVFVKNLASTGNNKLQDRWNSVPYRVLEQLSNLPVYKVKPETGTGGVRTLHRDNLLPEGDGVRMYLPKEEKGSRRPMVTCFQARASTGRENGTNTTVGIAPDESVEGSSDSDEMTTCDYYPAQEKGTLLQLILPPVQSRSNDVIQEE